jgi:hypothetical protein
MSSSAGSSGRRGLFSGISVHSTNKESRTTRRAIRADRASGKFAGFYPIPFDDKLATFVAAMFVKQRHLAGGGISLSRFTSQWPVLALCGRIANKDISPTLLFTTSDSRTYIDPEHPADHSLFFLTRPLQLTPILHQRRASNIRGRSSRHFGYLKRDMILPLWVHHVVNGDGTLSSLEIE